MINANHPSSKLLGAALLIGYLCSACSSNETEAQGPPPAVSVEIAQVEQDTLIDSSEFVGNLEAQRRVLVAPRVEGRIVNIEVQEGERVNQGQLLVQLQLDRERAEVNAQTSAIDAQRATLRNVQAEVRALASERDQAAAEVEQRRADLATAEANLQSRISDLQSNEANLSLAQSEFERYTFLIEEGVETQQQLDQRRRDLDTAVAERDSARRVRDAAVGSRNAARSSLNAAIEALNAARQRVEAAEATVEQEQAALNQAQSQRAVSEEELRYNQIFSPINGIVGDILPREGDYVEAGAEITTLTQNNLMNLNINVPIEYESQLRVGLPVEIVDQEGKASVTGQISFVSPTVVQDAQTVLAKATFSNDGRLRDDQFVRARVIWEQKPGVLVPTDSVTRIGGQNFVFVAEEQKTEDGKSTEVAKQKTVQLGDIQGQNYQVTSGLEPGARLIVSGVQTLSDGTPVTAESVKSETPSPVTAQ